MVEKPDPATAGGVASGAGAVKLAGPASDAPADMPKTPYWHNFSTEEKHRIRSDMVAQMGEGGASEFWPKSTQEQDEIVKKWARENGYTAPAGAEDLTQAEKDNLRQDLFSDMTPEQQAEWLKQSPQDQDMALLIHGNQTNAWNAN